MMGNRLSLIFLTVFCSRILYSQQQEVDSVIRMEEVVVKAVRPREHTNLGSMVTRLDSSLILQNNTRSLGDLLAGHTVLNIKSLGQGAQATASFRGTSSGHTQVLWNGVSLNPASLGSFDFSQIPVYFTDNVAVYHGAGAQQAGSGALGGSVDFTNNDTPVKKPAFSVLGEYGSNNTFTGATSFRITGKGLTASTRAYYQQSDNDYRYLNRVYGDKPYYEERQQADYRQAGVMQEFFYETAREDKVSLIAWYQFDDKSIPQSIISSATADENMFSHNFRLLANYATRIGKHEMKVTLANLWGDLKHTRDFGVFSELSQNKNNSMVLKGDYRFPLHRRLDTEASFTYRHDRVTSPAYGSKSVSRNSYTARAFALFRATKRLHFDLNLTGELVDRDLFGIYNVSGRYIAIERYLTLKASNAYNYRVPTLNDLYWSPGGNPDLSPERGFSWDLSLSSSPVVGRVHLDFELLYYKMHINDWIMWVPKENGYIWSPVNFSKVSSDGFEFSAKGRFSVGITSHALSGNYAYARSVDDSRRGDDAQGKQLPYIPRNKWNLNYELWFDKYCWLNYNLSFTDVRFTSADERYFTNAYYMHNAEIGGQYRFKRDYTMRLALKIENMLNDYYESTQYYPMPLRMFRIQLTYIF